MHKNRGSQLPAVDIYLQIYGDQLKDTNKGVLGRPKTEQQKQLGGDGTENGRM